MDFLKKLSNIQDRYRYLILFIVIVITIFMAFGVPKIQMETDFSNFSPQGLDIYKLNENIDSKFGGQDVVVILFRLDRNSSFENKYQNIKHPDIINYQETLKKEFLKEATVNQVISPSTYLSPLNPQSISQVNTIIKQNPQLDQFYNKQSNLSTLYIMADLGGAQEKTIQLTEMINQKLDKVEKPSGVETMVTGSAPVSVTLLDILGKDAINTLIIAAIIILILLFIFERSFLKGIVVFSPILLGVIWTMGTMGWLTIKLSVATVGIGAMILGLGVEYGVFMHTRYLEERKKQKTQRKTLEKTVPAIGSAILGSGMTTIIGFLALSFSIMPMLQDLGQSLALGIFYSLFIAVFISPTIIVLFEDFELNFFSRMYKESKKFLNKKSDNK